MTGLPFCGAVAAGSALAGEFFAPGGLNPEPQFPLPATTLAPELPAAEALQADRARPPATAADRRVHLYNVHTKETLDLVYFASGAYDEDSLARLSHFLRDWRAEAEIAVDPLLIDVVASIQDTIGREAPLYVLSGYRTAETNAWMASFNRDVARNSFHIRGKAIDIHQPGGSVAALRDAALTLQAGGVGFYPANGFVHVDTGPVRSWTGGRRSTAAAVQEAQVAR